MVPRLGVIALLGVLWLVACGAPPPQPHVVLVVIDGLRADRIGSYGAPVLTPRMDELSEEALRFENAIAPSSRGSATLASIFTGKAPSEHGLLALGGSLSGELPVLAERFRAAGYTTAAVSPSRVFHDPATGLGRGFDERPIAKSVRGEIDPGQPLILARDKGVTKRAIDWLNQEHTQPFLLFVHYLGPLPDYEAKDRFKRRGSLYYQGPVDGTLEQLKQLARGELEVNELDAAHLRSLYQAEVLAADTELRRLLDHLERRGYFDDAIVAVTSTHGTALRDHGDVFYMTSLFREQIRVPLWIRRPGGRGGDAVVPRAVELAQLGPTLAALAGLEADADAGWAGSLDDEAWAGDADALARSELSAAPSVAAVWGSRRHRAAVTSAGWSLLEDPQGGLSLFDLAADPGQQRDVAGEAPDRVERLSASLPKLP